MKLISRLVLLSLLLTPLPANAHDQLVDQSPADGELVTAGVVSIELTFNSELLSLAGTGAEILVTGPDGDPMHPGCAVVDQRRALLDVDLDQPGEYKVAWRVVSSDGHPITGSFGFQLENSAGYQADPDFMYVDCPNPVLIATEEPADQSGYWLLWVSLSLVGAGLFFFLRPRRQKPE